jgi:hypothetical protein
VAMGEARKREEAEAMASRSGGRDSAAAESKLVWGSFFVRRN